MAKQVLIVDDNRDGADAWAIFLKEMGEGTFTVEVLYGGQACLDRLAQPPHVDILILDIDMPKVSGADVIRHLLKMDPLPALKVIPVTAWGYEWEQQWGLAQLKDTPAYQQLVAQSFDKVISPEVLLTKLRELANESPSAGG